jgi:hypothetical protein
MQTENFMQFLFSFDALCKVTDGKCHANAFYFYVDGNLWKTIGKYRVFDRFLKPEKLLNHPLKMHPIFT